MSINSSFDYPVFSQGVEQNCVHSGPGHMNGFLEGSDRSIELQALVETVSPVKEITTYQDALSSLKARRIEHISYPNRRVLDVAVLGAGPAGLIRAIESFLHGHKTYIIEKRSSRASRSNIVSLKPDSIGLLKQYGIYQWLLARGLIFPVGEEGTTSVQLGDLEQAMKQLIGDLDTSRGEVVFEYETTIRNIDSSKTRAVLRLSENDGEIDELPVDVIVNAEGQHSSTNSLLGIGRVEVLPKVPVFTAFYKDDRPKVTSVGKGFEYVGKTIQQCAVAIYYYVILLFKMVFQREWFENDTRNIAGSLILKTPGQVYLGCGLTHKLSTKLSSLYREIQSKEEALERATRQNREPLLAELNKLKKKYDSSARFWIQLSFCKANLIALGLRMKGDKRFSVGHMYNLTSFSKTEIGADKATDASYQLQHTAYLVAGDALATVDPTTGLGANTAIQTSEQFVTFLEGAEVPIPLPLLLEKYNEDANAKVEQIHAASLENRLQYRPDAAFLPSYRRRFS